MTERIKIAEIDHNENEGERVELFLVPDAAEDGPYHVEDEHGWHVLVNLTDREDAERHLTWRFGDRVWGLTLEAAPDVPSPDEGRSMTMFAAFDDASIYAVGATAETALERAIADSGDSDARFGVAMVTDEFAAWIEANGWDGMRRSFKVRGGYLVDTSDADDAHVPGYPPYGTRTTVERALHDRDDERRGEREEG